MRALVVTEALQIVGVYLSVFPSELDHAFSFFSSRDRRRSSLRMPEMVIMPSLARTAFVYDFERTMVCQSCGIVATR